MNAIKKTILLVEDEILTAMTERIQLEKYGYSIIITETGELAVQTVQNSPDIDLILMDIDLGSGIDGPTAAAEILKIKEIPIVFLSTHTNPEIVEKTEKITSYGYVVKSSTITVLDASIKMAFKLFDANKKYSEKRLFLESALAAMSDAVFISDLSGKIVEFNDAFASFHRFKNKSECADQLSEYPKIFDLLSENGEPLPVNQWVVSRTLRGETAVNQEYSLHRKDTGETWTVSYNFSPIRDQSGGIIGSAVVGRDITEQKQINDKLKESEEMFSKIFKSSPIAISITRIKDGIISMVNDAWCSLTGYTREEITGKTYSDLKIFATGNSLDEISADTDLKLFETDILTKPGTLKKVTITNEITVIRNIPYSINLISDITELKAAENKIREMDIKLSKLFANVPDMIYQFTKSPEGNFSVPISSHGIIQIFGCTPEDVADSFQPIADVIFPDDFERVIADIERSADNLSYFNCEFRVQIPGRKIQWINSRSTPEKLPDGSITWYGFIVDITSMKKTEELLRSSERDLKESQRIAHLGSWRMDLQTNELTWTEELYKMYGFDPSLPPPPYSEHMKLFTPESWKLLSPALDNTVKTGIPYELELETVKGNGDHGWMWVRCETVTDSEGKITGVWGAAQDITKRKMDEQQIKLLLSQKELLLKEVHHRIKNNITSIEALLLLQYASNNNAEIRTALSEAVSRVQSIRVLYDKLLINTDYQEISVKTYIESLVQSLTDIFEEKEKIKITTHISDFNLTSKKIMPVGIIINELLTNIFKYAFVGRECGEVLIKLLKAGNEAELTITDNGNGMDTGDKDEKPSGFGLTMVKMMTDQLQGSFNMQNNNGMKSILKFTV
ncbi:MAG: PAS domain S-box protein [Spirochaetes bacterium]|nr:PAS domain S-box protein [Spirochaetota bacterium]